jgi:hypothetical protein
MSIAQVELNRPTFDVTEDRSAKGTRERSLRGVRLTEWLEVADMATWGLVEMNFLVRKTSSERLLALPRGRQRLGLSGFRFS